jgi:hypothetical protein
MSLDSPAASNPLWGSRAQGERATEKIDTPTERNIQLTTPDVFDMKKPSKKVKKPKLKSVARIRHTLRQR